MKDLCPPGIYVTVHNDTKTCTICGPEEKIPNFVNSLLSQGIVAKTIKSSAGVAFHTPLIAKEAEVLAAKIQKVIKMFKFLLFHKENFKYMDSPNETLASLTLET